MTLIWKYYLKHVQSNYWTKLNKQIEVIETNTLEIRGVAKIFSEVRKKEGGGEGKKAL